MASQWLEGTIRHRRNFPVQHEFRYNIGMLALDLDDWPTVTRISPLFSQERFNWLGLYRRDYLDPEVPSLRQAVFNRVKSATGWAPDGPVELVTHPRYLGYIFNPVSFYLCYERGCNPAAGATPRVIVAQITNTPWQQRHVYCLECRPAVARFGSRLAYRAVCIQQAFPCISLQRHEPAVPVAIRFSGRGDAHSHERGGGRPQAL